MLRKSFIIIAVDGGAASGKSTTSREVAQRLNLLHVDTGAHYRAITLIALREKERLENNDSLAEALNKLELNTVLQGRRAMITIEGRVPTQEELRSPEVTAFVSHLSAMPSIRELLKNYQRSLPEIAKKKNFNGMIMEGRDIGSVIFPKADFKFFLEADQSIRAKRRENEGQKDVIAMRDKLDANRKVGPLTCPEDAVRIDTSKNSKEEVVEKICKLVEEGIYYK